MSYPIGSYWIWKIGEPASSSTSISVMIVKIIGKWKRSGLLDVLVWIISKEGDRLEHKGRMPAAAISSLEPITEAEVALYFL